MELEKIIEKCEGDFKDMMLGGFTALYDGFFEDAQILFQAAYILDETHTAPYYGFLYIALYTLKYEQVRQIANEILKLDPQDYTAYALLGVGYALERKEIDTGLEIIEEAVTKSQDPIIAQLRGDVLAWIQQQKSRVSR